MSSHLQNGWVRYTKIVDNKVKWLSNCGKWLSHVGVCGARGWSGHVGSVFVRRADRLGWGHASSVPHGHAWLARWVGWLAILAGWLDQATELAIAPHARASDSHLTPAQPCPMWPIPARACVGQSQLAPHWPHAATFVTEPPQEGVHRQDQLEWFLVKWEYNQHT
jgi:hypothetical protein